MIFKETIIKATDNSGARLIRCIDPYTKKNYQTYGNLLNGVITHLRWKRRQYSKVKRKSKYQILIIHSYTNKKSKTLYKTHFTQNSGIPLSQQMKPFATRIKTKLPQQFRYSKYFKLITISGGLIY